MLEAANRVPHNAARRGRRFALELDEQQAGDLRRVRDELQQGLIQQLERGWFQGHQVRHRLGHRLEIGESERRPRDAGRNRVETPLDLGHDRERPFGSHQEIDVIA